MLNKQITIEYRKDKATLATYVLDNYEDVDPGRTRPMVIICPGGAYHHLSNREAEAVAIQMNAMGFHACVLRYSLYPAKFPTALIQLAKSVALVREHAAEWNVDPDKLIISGFSAGGHLAASLGTLWSEEFLSDIMQMDNELYRPDGLILSYPVITTGEYAEEDSIHTLLQDNYQELKEKVSLERQVSEMTPPTFLWHTFEDTLVPMENSLLFAASLRKYKIPFELHIYPRGPHGLSLATEETRNPSGTLGALEECQNWITMAGTWIRNLNK